MNRVLSYQTAMSANTGRDVREYVTKRTCVSLILTIAFFTLISGFLLGKFVADRQHHIKQYRESDVAMLRNLLDAKDSLITTARDIVNHSNTSVHETLSNEFYSKYISCIKDDSRLNYKDRVDEFVEKFLDNKIPQQAECFTKLSEFLQFKEKPTN